ncbi:hypothetical protein PENSPDRAFT_649919 [Peniophora sp. CONT]|nr:hypothetical protein PENSPDRAFT_649919 [Peniophora sp. CONT]
MATFSSSLTSMASTTTVDRSQSVAKPTALQGVKSRITHEARAALSQIILSLVPGRRVPQPIVTVTPPTPIALDTPNTVPDVNNCHSHHPEDFGKLPPGCNDPLDFVMPTLASGFPPTLRGRSRKRGSYKSRLHTRAEGRGLDVEGLALALQAMRQAAVAAELEEAELEDAELENMEPEGSGLEEKTD